MSYTEIIGLAALSLFLAMVLCLELGRRIGLRHLEKNSASPPAAFGAMEGSIFALLGLLLAFTFSGAATRFDVRRHLIIEETNAVGTAYLRLDLLPAAAQPALRESFRRYLDARIAAYRKISSTTAAREELAQANHLQGEIWRLAIAAVRADGAPPQAALVLLPALNAMIDITTTRTMSTQIHPPAIIFILIYTLALVCSLLAGFGMAAATTRSWFHMITFAAVMAVSVYVIHDLEYPRLGLIRVDAFDQALIDLRQTMK